MADGEPQHTSSDNGPGDDGGDPADRAKKQSDNDRGNHADTNGLGQPNVLGAGQDGTSSEADQCAGNQCADECCDPSRAPSFWSHYASERYQPIDASTIPSIDAESLLRRRAGDLDMALFLFICVGFFRVNKE